jgi:hypothetical protein
MTLADEIIAIQQEATFDQFGSWLASNAHRIIEALREVEQRAQRPCEP